MLFTAAIWEKRYINYEKLSRGENYVSRISRPN